MGFVCIVLGALAYCKVSEIDTDRIEPLMDTLTVKAIQPLGAVKSLSLLLIVLGVFIILFTLFVVVVILCEACCPTEFVQVRVSIDK